jgi:hypothetical protein
MSRSERFADTLIGQEIPERRENGELNMVKGLADAIDDVVARTQAAMAEASGVVLSGFRLRSERKIVRWPDRYMGPRGTGVLDRVTALLPA